MLDTNPCLNVTIERLESLYPDHALFPYYPFTNDPAKFSLIIVPLKYVQHKLSHNEIVELVYHESKGIFDGRVSQMQYGLHQLQRKFDLKVISLEDFFAEQVKKELMEVGYETDIYYHNSLTSGDLPKGVSRVEQDLVYKPVTDTATVRQWGVTDEKFLVSLSNKGLSLPGHINEEFLMSLREKGQKLFGAEILVINARKI